MLRFLIDQEAAGVKGFTKNELTGLFCYPRSHDQDEHVQLLIRYVTSRYLEKMVATKQDFEEKLVRQCAVDAERVNESFTL